MMMDHHRFIRQNKNSNVMIGGPGSRSGSSVTTDELTASDPASAGDFDYSNTMDGSNNSAIHHGHSPPSIQSPVLQADDGFDKITMDFDSIIGNDLESSQPRKSVNSDNTSVNSEMILEKLQAELNVGTSELKGMGGVSPLDHVKGKVGDIGDELDIAILDNLISTGGEGSNLPQETGNQQGQESSDSNMDQIFNDNQSVSSMDKLLNGPLIDMDGHNDSNAGDDINTIDKKNPNTANTLKKVDSSESLCDSMASLPSIGKISPNASFANINNTGMQKEQIQQQQQQAMLLQQQQLQQQQQQQQQNNSSSVQAIVNDQFAHLSQGNGMAGFEEEKMKLIRRLQQIENAGTAMDANQQQEQQQQQQQIQQQMQQQQLLLQKQMLLQQQLQQQQQQRMGSASSMPSLRTGGQLLQGAMQMQAQQNFMNQQMIQQQQKQQQGALAQGMMAHQQITNNSNSNSPGNAQSNGNDDNNAKKKGNISSVMGLKKGKDTPLLSFLRNKKRSGGTSGTSMMSMTVTQQQQLAGAPVDSSLVGASNHSNSSTSNSSVLDAAPYDFSASSNNPLLRKQMMSNLDKSVNRMNSVRGRIGGMAGGRGLSSSIRRSMIEQMSVSGQMSKSSKELQTRRFSDSYESAGIISRVSSADHIMSRRASLTPGAAKAQNRRFSLNRSNNSFGNLTKSGLRRELTKSGGGGSTRSLTGVGSSTRSLGSHDSSSSLIPIKRRGSSSGFNGAKHKLGSTRRTSSVPYMGSALGESAATLQQRFENQQQGLQQNDGWP